MTLIVVKQTRLSSSVAKTRIFWANWVNTIAAGALTAAKTGMILGLRAANERRRYKVTPSPIGWAQT